MIDGPGHPIHPLWRSYRRWWGLLGVSSALCVGFAIVLKGSAADLVLANPRAWPPLLAFLGLVLAAVRILDFRCPGCRKQFHSRWQGFLPRPNPLSDRCLNCGFPKWKDPPSR